MFLGSDVLVVCCGGRIVAGRLSGEKFIGHEHERSGKVLVEVSSIAMPVGDISNGKCKNSRQVLKLLCQATATSRVSVVVD